MAKGHADLNPGLLQPWDPAPIPRGAHPSLRPPWDPAPISHGAHPSPARTGSPCFPQLRHHAPLGIPEGSQPAACKRPALPCGPPIPSRRWVNAPNPLPPRLAGLYERKRAALEAFKKSLLHQALAGKL